MQAQCKESISKEILPYASTIPLDFAREFLKTSASLEQPIRRRRALMLMMRWYENIVACTLRRKGLVHILVTIYLLSKGMAGTIQNALG